MAKDVNFLKLDFEILDRAGRYAEIAGVAVVVTCDYGWVYVVGRMVGISCYRRIATGEVVPLKF